MITAIFIIKADKQFAMQPTGRIFMEMTRYKHLAKADQFRGMQAPPLEEPAPEEGKFISLPPPSQISVPPMEMRSAIESRRSVRRYSENFLSIEELSYLLWCTQGIKE